LNSDDVISHLNKIIAVNNILGNPATVVKAIFKKIGIWQKENDGFNQQDEFISNFTSGTVKNATQMFKEI
jgi:hypothetical protein